MLAPLLRRIATRRCPCRIRGIMAQTRPDSPAACPAEASARLPGHQGRDRHRLRPDGHRRRALRRRSSLGRDGCEGHVALSGLPPVAPEPPPAAAGFRPAGQCAALPGLKCTQGDGCRQRSPRKNVRLLPLHAPNRPFRFRPVCAHVGPRLSDPNFPIPDACFCRRRSTKVGPDNLVRFIDAFVDGPDLAAAGFARLDALQSPRSPTSPDRTDGRHRPPASCPSPPVRRCRQLRGIVRTTCSSFSGVRPATST